MRFYSFKFAENEQNLELVRDLFCFMAFTSLRYSDLENLKKANVFDDHIEICTKKTRDKLLIHLIPHAKEIINKYKDEVLYLDHKSVLFIKRLHTYAVCSGSNGVNELPALYALPENYNDFDPANYSELTAKVAEREVQETINESVARDVRQRQSKLRRS